MTSKDFQNDSSAIKKPWLVWIEAKVRHYGEDTVEASLLEIVKKLLISDNEKAPTVAAHQIDEFYQKIFLPTDPLMRFEEDKGWTEFLNTLYTMIFDVVERVRWNDPKQDSLMNLITALRQLPPRPAKIYDVS